MNKEFWIQVLEEYSNCEWSKFLCHYSKTFDKNWRISEEGIKELGREYLIHIKEDKFYISDGVLFNSKVYSSYSPEFRQIRIDFLNWMIERS